MPHTLVISNRDDVSIGYLLSKMNDRGISHLRINSEDIGSLHFNIDPKGEKLCTFQETVHDLNTVSSVIFRRIPVKYDVGLDGENHKYLNHERKHFFEGLFLTLQDVKWINPMFGTQIAERKLYQLQIANRLGLRIPKSIITNQLSVALDFLRKQTSAIIKPISNGLQVVGEKVYSIYTTKVDIESFVNLQLAPVFDTPIFLQEGISNEGDIRVTIVGQSVFSVKIIKDGTEVDWRRPDVMKRYELIQLPPQLEEQLLNINRHFGLIYSAIDLILTPEGEYVFLEVNPVGEWVWLEMELGINISHQIISELI
jgi:glutathione synthase/RimK-type ligase-like ATP-grasp enzyme